jgi:hypothetical protein
VTQTPRRLWTLTRQGRTATREAHPHPLGLEVVVTVDGDIQRTETFRIVPAAEATSTEWRALFTAKGWTAC